MACEGSTLLCQKIYLLAIFSILRLAKGDRATSFSFASRNGSIDASRLSLEAEMERYFMLLEGEGGHFANEKKTYLLVLFTFVHGAEGDRATSPSSASKNGSTDGSRSSPELQI